MTQKIDQKAYLQKYLAGPSKEKKKKKKKTYKGKGLQIIDDDLDYSKLRALEGDELDVYGEGEDAPQIAGIIDDRPEDVKKAEQYKLTSKWKVINQDDGFNSKIQIKEIQKDVKELQEENQLVFGKMYSDSEDEKQIDSDVSPPRKTSEKQNGNKQQKQSRGDSDCSPPRRNNKSSPRNKKPNSDSDVSPPRKRETIRKDRPRKESRWGHFPKETNPDPSPNIEREETNQTGRNHKTDRNSDQSPHRKSQKYSSQRGNKSGAGKSINDSDISPPRKSRRKSPGSDISPPRKNRRSPDSDISPPRKSRRKSPDSDISPPRKNRRKSPDSDISPPRKNRRKSPDSDISPPRKTKSRSDPMSNRRDSPPPSNKRMEKTLEGKMAGLQDARQLRVENDAFRRREEEAFSRMTDDVSGRNAQVAARRSKRGDSEERRQKQEKAERQKDLDEKYKKWGKGIKQLEDQEARARDYLEEAAKPLARYSGDAGLEARLRGVERAGDPMLQYVRERRRERGELGPEKPAYKGNFPPNRFNIPPGYRWDGVDRSNGYEKKYFDTQSKKKAQAEEYHMWSCADL